MEHRRSCFEDMSDFAANLESWSPAGPAMGREPVGMACSHATCRQWLMMLQKLMSSHSLNRSIDLYQVIWDVLSCGNHKVHDVHRGTRPENFVEVMELFVTTENHVMWMKDFMSRGHILYIFIK
jgi:hypothetical protein